MVSSLVTELPPGRLIAWYVVCLLRSGPSFPVCLLLFVALAGLSGLAIFNLLNLQGIFS